MAADTVGKAWRQVAVSLQAPGTSTYLHNGVAGAAIAIASAAAAAGQLLLHRRLLRLQLGLQDDRPSALLWLVPKKRQCMLAQEARSLCMVKLQVTGPKVLSKSFALANIGGHRSISRLLWKDPVAQDVFTR